MVFNITKIPTISDDTGLEVDALDGNPGVYTARFAGENCSYDDNINKMLKVLENVDDNNRRAIFKTAMAFVDKKSELFSEGIVEGMISKNKKGLAGFGYDAIFYDPKLFGAVGDAPSPGGAPAPKLCEKMPKFGPEFHFQLQMDASFDANEKFG